MTVQDPDGQHGLCPKYIRSKSNLNLQLYDETECSNLIFSSDTLFIVLCCTTYTRIPGLRGRYSFYDLALQEYVDFLSHTEDEILHMMYRFTAVCTAFGLNNSLKKTNVMLKLAPGETYIAPSIILDGSKLDRFDRSVYLAPRC